MRTLAYLSSVKSVLPLAFGLMLPVAVQAQSFDEPFSETKDGNKIHEGSGFVCPVNFAGFTRDAVRGGDAESGTASCSYSQRDGVYGNITLSPLQGGYKAKDSMAARFREQEVLGAKMVFQGVSKIGTPELSVYVRVYQTGKLENLKYTVLFAGSAVKNWVVETSVEYTDPRDTGSKDAFLEAVYDAAQAQIGN